MIKYKIVETNTTENSIVVRFYTDTITESSLATQLSNTGAIMRCRTDYSLDMPYIMPDAVELDRIIMLNAPRRWLKLKEEVLLGGASPSLTAITPQLNVVRTEPVITFAMDKAGFIHAVKTEAGQLTSQVLKGLGSEYELAERQAIDYKAAGYPVATATAPVPSSIVSEVNSKAAKNVIISAAEACHIIIASAAGWRTAQASLRDKRLTVSSAAEIAVDDVGLNTLKAQWDEFLAALKLQMGA